MDATRQGSTGPFGLGYDPFFTGSSSATRGRRMSKTKKKLETRGGLRCSSPVLAAIDFSAASLGVVRWAARAAAAFGVPLRVLHVVHDPESAPGSYSTKRKKRKRHLERLEDAAGSMMDEFTDRLRAEIPEIADVELTVELVSGLPVTRILEVAERCGAGLVVVGSRGRTGLPHLLLGSKAERLAQLAPIPVTIVKDGSPG